MPLAELHGKATRATRRSEDALTSAVLNLLTVTDPEWVFAPWLRRARRLDGSELDLAPVLGIDACFWPRLGDDGGPRAEPDALLALTFGERESLMVILEAKYRSGPSGWPLPPDAQESAELVGQLGRQWCALNRERGGRLPGDWTRGGERVLIYLTADVRSPRATLTRMQSEVERLEGRDEGRRFRDGLYWLSWFSLFDVLQRVGEPRTRPSRMVRDRLGRLLERRRLAGFSSCSPPPRVAVCWEYAGAEDRLATRPDPDSTYPSAPRTPTPYLPWHYGRESAVKDQRDGP